MDEDDVETGRSSQERVAVRKSFSHSAVKRKTVEEEELDKKLLAEQELRHHRRSVIFIQKKTDSADKERRGSTKRTSSRMSARRSNAMALRDQLKRKSAINSNNSNSNNSGVWGWLGLGDSTSSASTSNPMASHDVEMSHVSVSKRRSQIESGAVVVLNIGKPGSPNRRAVTTMALEDVQEFIADLKKDMHKALSVMDVDGGVAMFRIASKKATDLTLLPVRLFSGDDLKALFSKVFAILTVHGAISLRLPIEAVTTTQLDRIAYIIGTRVFTAREIRAISTGDSPIGITGVPVAEIGDLTALAAVI